MSKLKRNIVCVGNDSFYKENLKLKDNKIFTNINSIYNLNHLERKQGFLLICCLDDLYEISPDVVDMYDIDVYEIDRHARKMFRNFEYVVILSNEEFEYGLIPFSNMYVYFLGDYLDNDEGLNPLINKLYEKYKLKKEEKISRIKNENIQKLKKYIKNKNFITTQKIMKDLKVNEKWIQRYMKDMNKTYSNIGYNKRKRLWYRVKNSYKNS
ncbi:MAG: hypothetical protein IJX34_02855 [Clostridia bacterium]|nr:hypothetical protein [Clostridia bacterium]